MISLYGFHFSWNKFLGYSALSDPLEMIGLLIIIVVLVEVAINVRVLLRMYRESKSSPNLAWLIHYITLFFGVIFLIFEKVALSTLGSLAFGYFSAIVAFSLATIAILAVNYFAFDMAYPEHTKVLTVFVSILGIIFVVILTLALISGTPYADVINYEIVYELTISLIIYPILSFILIIPPISFYYYYGKMHEENRPKALLALWMGNGYLCFVIGLIFEVVPFFPTELSTWFRILFVIAALIMYICFTKPNWFKEKIGWTE